MNNNKIDAQQLFDQLNLVEYCNQGRDLQQEQDVLAVFQKLGFEQIKLAPAHKTKEQKQLFLSGRANLSKLAIQYNTGLYVSHHPFGKNRYPDFILILNGKILEFEVKSASTEVPIFTHGDQVIDPCRRDSIYLFTHKTQGSAMLLAEDLMSPTNYLLIQKHKAERLALQQKHDAEFDKVCSGKGEKVYHRTNLVPRGGSNVTNHIERARQHNLSEKVLYMLKTYI